MTTPTDVVDRLARAVGEGDLDGALTLISPSAVDHAPLPGAAPGLEGWREKWEALGQQMSQVEIEVQQRVAEGDTVATRYAIRAVEGGQLLGYALDMVRVADGRVVEHWALPLPEQPR